MMTYFTKFVLAIVALTILFSAPFAKAALSTQCSIDQPVTGQVDFQQCIAFDSNNAILNSGFDGVRLDASTSPSKTPIWAYNVCRYVDYTNTANALFIPLKSQQEWLAFIANPPVNVKFAGCCIPRAMLVSDVPTPPTACAAKWVLKGLVETANRKKLLATPSSTSVDATFNLLPSLREDTTYPITKLPIGRDDSGAVLPDNANPAKTYAALFSCGDKLDTYVDFRLKCKETEWVTESATEASASTASETITPVSTTDEPTSNKQTTETIVEDIQASASTAAACEISKVRTYTKPCANGSPGSTSFRDVFNSCTKTIDAQIVSSTCPGISGGINGGINGCVTTSDTRTTPCPNNQTGTIVTQTNHICDGSNNGEGRDATTIISNTCAATGGGGSIGGGLCVPVDTLTTTPCPDPKVGGIITLRRVIVCDGSNNGAGRTTETVVSNTCQPSGCVNSIMLKTSTVCTGGTLVTAKVYNSCTKEISTTTISNTCR